MHDSDENPRPAKRPKTGAEHEEQPQRPQQLTLANLLLTLPSVLLHPPTHTNHERSLALSHYALKKCTTMTSLDRAVECRAATGLAEIGLQIGLSSSGVQNEIQKSITKASLVAQNLPSLQLYRPRLTQLSAQLSLLSGNAKVAQNNLKRSLMTITPNDPPHVLYTTHLAYIASISSQSSDETTNTMRSLGAINDLHEAASKRDHRPVIQLASVLRLRAFMRSGLWSDVSESLNAAENVLSMEDTLKSYAEDGGKFSENGNQKSAPLPSPPVSSKSTRPAFEYALIVHTLVLGVIFHTYTGEAGLTGPRLKWLYELLDVHLPRFPKTGIFEISFLNAPPLYYQLTHPRVIYVLGFLVSSLAKRDLVGKKPKKRVFAGEGITAVDKELKKEIACPIWASISDVRETDCRLKKLRADLMCELISASIMKSEFDEAERLIDEIVSYTRTQDIFSSYAARITLHEAQLAHALNKPQRALQCYQVAAWLSRKRERHRYATFPQTHISADGSPTKSTYHKNSEPVDGDGEEDVWINAAARAGELWLRIGLLRQSLYAAVPEGMEGKEIHGLRKIGESVIKECRGLGGTLEAVAEVLDGCLSTEFVKAKTHLRRALNLTTSSQDNHLRALILSLIASHYLHTSGQHAEKMLETAESLSVGLGARSKNSASSFTLNSQNQSQNSTSPVKGKTPGEVEGVVGNVYLRSWIGERFLELFNRAGNKEVATVQITKNKRLREAVIRVEMRL